MLNSVQTNVLAGLIQCWIAGPVWGANIVLCALAARQLLMPSVSHSRRRLLLATIIALAVISCTQAVVSLADLISGFSGSRMPFMYFGNPQRSLFVAKTSLYFGGMVMADSFMAWRAYVAWDRNKLIAASAAVVTLANIAVGVAGIVELAPAAIGLSIDSIALNLYSLNWGLSLLLQGGCSLLIGWRKISNPVTVHTQSIDLWTLAGIFWLIVESGILYSVITLITLIFSYISIVVVGVFVGVLGQVTVLIPVSIMLREAWKTEHVQRDTVNSQTFLVEDRTPYSQTESLEFNDDSISADQAHPGVFIRIKVSTHGDSEA